jgi:hypothetical protein
MTGPADYSATFKTALSKRERHPLCRITYCNLSWQPQEVITGVATPDSSFSLDDQGHRQVSLRLINNDGSRTPDPSSDSWFGRFVVEWGLMTGAGQEWVDLGRFVATSQGAQVQASAGWTSLGLMDQSALWGTFDDYWVISANDRIVDVIAAIALDAGVASEDLNLYRTDEIVGADMVGTPGSSRWDLARRIAQAAQDVGLVLNLTYRQRQCVLYPEVDPATATAASWTFSRGDGIMVALDKRWEQQDFANRIQVYGGSGKSATIFSEIADTSDGPYGSQRRGDWCYKWPDGQEFDPLITTQERADARRDYLYRMRRTSQETVQVQGLITPGLNLADVVRVEEQQVTRKAANYTLRGGYSFGLGPGGSMSLTVRRVVRP